MPPSPRRALVFDLDGTLIDSAPDLQAALNRVLVGIGRRPLDLAEVTRMIGDGVPKLVERAMAATGGLPDGETLDDLAKWVSRFADEYKGHGADQTYVYPGVAETLAKLKADGFAIGVCTNKPHAAAGEVLEGLGLMPFVDCYCGGDAIPEAQRKPQPGHARAVLDALGAEASEGVMVGDLLNDILCGQGAGMPVVFCTYGYATAVPDGPAPDAVIDHFEELPAALLRLP